MPEILLDCCRVADALPIASLAQDWGLKPPRAHREALALDREALGWILREQDPGDGQAFVYENGCVVAAGMDRARTQELLLHIADLARGSDYERMMTEREIRTVPHAALAAQARALSSSVVLDALEKDANRLMDSAERSLTSRRLWGARHRQRQKHLAALVAFRYECVHGQGILDRPDTRWDMRQQRAYRALAAELRLHERTELLSHKLDELEGLLGRAHGEGSTRQASRQLWLEVWMLVLFPIGHAIEILFRGSQIQAWMQQMLRLLRLS